MKQLALLVAVAALVIAGQAERAQAQAVNANIQTTCTLDATNAAVPANNWLLTVPANPNTRNGATVNINNCNTNWAVSAVDNAGTGNMTATAGSTDHSGNAVNSALTDPLVVNGANVAVDSPVDSGNPTVNFDVPVTYAQNAQYADVAILPASGSYQITLIYTLTFTP